MKSFCLCWEYEYLVNMNILWRHAAVFVLLSCADKCSSAVSRRSAGFYYGFYQYLDTIPDNKQTFEANTDVICENANQRMKINGFWCWIQ